MRIKSILILLMGLFAFGCAHHPVPVSDRGQQAPVVRAQEHAVLDTNPGPGSPEAVSSVALQPLPDQDTAITHPNVDADLAGDYQEPDTGAPTGSGQGDQAGIQKGDTSELTIADPLEPFNRAMFQFNDKLYFWVLKPVSQGYKWLVHEDLRVMIGNFFSNAAFPVRFVNCLLQANLPGAAGELGRFVLNTAVGFGGLFDPASDKEINLAKHHEDLGQTLGVYGIGQGFYIHWPILGPSSPRDTVGKVGDGFLNPFSYLEEWYETAGVKTFETVNDTSFRIGDYEALKKAAIDPYIAVRNAYLQHRAGSVRKREGFYSPVKADR